MELSWKTSLGGQEYRIFREKLIVGLLKRALIIDDAYGELNGYLLRFKTTGFWDRKTQILDIDGNNELGMIQYNRWKSSAVITFEGKSYDWKYESLWRRNWFLSAGDEKIAYSGTSIWKNEGDIRTEQISPVLVLSGLFVHAYFKKIAGSS